MRPPRVDITSQLVDRIDAVEIRGLYMASRNLKARYLLDYALSIFETAQTSQNNMDARRRDR